MFVDIINILQMLGVTAAAISGVMVASKRHLDLFGALVLGCATAVGGGIIRDILLGITPPQMFRDPSYVLLALCISSAAVAFLYISKRKYLEKYCSGQVSGTASADHSGSDAAVSDRKDSDTAAAGRSSFDPGASVSGQDIPRKRAQFSSPRVPDAELPPVYDFILNTADSLGLAAFAISGVQTVSGCGYEHSFFLSMFIGLVTAVGGGVIRDILAGRTPVILRKRIYALAALAGCILYYTLINATGLSIVISSVISMTVMVMIRHLAYIFEWNMPAL